MRYMPFKSHPQPSVQEAALEPRALAIGLSIYSELSAVAIPAARFVQGLGSPEKNPAYQKLKLKNLRLFIPGDLGIQPGPTVSKLTPSPGPPPLKGSAL